MNNIASKIKIPGLPQVIPLLTVMMEVFWIYAWLLWVATVPALHWNAAPLNLISCLILGLLVEILSRSALASNWSLRKVRLIILPVSFLALFVIIRLNLGGGYGLTDAGWFNYVGGSVSKLVTVIFFGVFIIWRGISTGQQDNSFHGLYRKFVLGLVAIILVLIVWRFGISSVGNIWTSVGTEILLFFGCGLLALAISNLERLRLELAQHQEATTSFSRRWVSMLVILVVAILGVGIIMTGLLSQETGSTIVHFLGQLGNWLLTGFIYLLYPVGFLAQILLWVGKFLLSLIRREPPPPLDPANLGGPPQEWVNNGEGNLPAALVETLKWGAIVLVAALVIYFLSRLLSRYWTAKTEEGVEEVHETLGSWKLLRMDLRGFLSWLWNRLRRRKPIQPEDYAEFKSAALETESDKMYTIREIYRAILWEGRQEGMPRRSTETPYEYSRRLRAHRENLAEDLDTLTEAYVVERYGQNNPGPERVTWLNRVWRSLRNKFRNKESDL